jgi:hypothetical protein
MHEDMGYLLFGYHGVFISPGFCGVWGAGHDTNGRRERSVDARVENQGDLMITDEKGEGAGKTDTAFKGSGITH